MKKYKVELLDNKGNVLLSHNLWALSDENAHLLCRECVKNARNKDVVNYKLN